MVKADRLRLRHRSFVYRIEYYAYQPRGEADVIQVKAAVHGLCVLGDRGYYKAGQDSKAYADRSTAGAEAAVKRQHRHDRRKRRRLNRILNYPAVRLVFAERVKIPAQHEGGEGKRRFAKKAEADRHEVRSQCAARGAEAGGLVQKICAEPHTAGVEQRAGQPADRRVVGNQRCRCRIYFYKSFRQPAYVLAEHACGHHGQREKQHCRHQHSVVFVVVVHLSSGKC